jgi:2,3-bisphosphoglycerate-dependent phosphoglycerate mutase
VLVSRTAIRLRALIMVLDKLGSDTIAGLELATGVPIVYRLNADTTVAEKHILGG